MGPRALRLASSGLAPWCMAVDRHPVLPFKIQIENEGQGGLPPWIASPSLGREGVTLPIANEDPRNTIVRGFLQKRFFQFGMSGRIVNTIRIYGG